MASSVVAEYSRPPTLNVLLQESNARCLTPCAELNFLLSPHQLCHYAIVLSHTARQARSLLAPTRCAAALASSY
eukprot:9017919-Pyramimonas_sp.AAC.1